MTTANSVYPTSTGKPLNPQDFALPLEVLDQYQGFIFDLDGTLIDSIPSHMRAWMDTGKKYGQNFDPKLIHSCTGSSPRDIAKKVMTILNMDLSQLDELLETKYDLGVAYITELAPLLPTWDIAMYYYGKKPIGIGTGGIPRFVEVFEQKYQLSKYFGAIVTAADVTKHKPNPETFITVAQKLGVDPTKCLVFEDGQYGIQAALAGGMDVYDVVHKKLHRAPKASS